MLAPPLPPLKLKATESTEDMEGERENCPARSRRPARTFEGGRGALDIKENAAIDIEQKAELLFIDLFVASCLTSGFISLR